MPFKPDVLPDSPVASATTVRSIVRAFRLFSRAKQEMVVMAQPFGRCGEPDPPAFRICAFSTDNKFNAGDVQHRMDTIVQELRKVGLEMVIYSADGDTRRLKVMKELCRLGFPQHIPTGLE